MTPGRLAYAPPAWLVALLAAASVAALAAAARSHGGGRFLFGVLGAATAFEALRSALLRPTLAADEHGLEVVTGLRRTRVAWPEVAAVGVLGPPGGGGRARRRANALEIDLGERLLVVPGYRLGAPVSEVARRLSTNAAPAPGGTGRS